MYLNKWDTQHDVTVILGKDRIFKGQYPSDVNTIETKINSKFEIGKNVLIRILSKPFVDFKWLK